MRCDCCSLGSDEDVCPEAENEYGIEHKDGVLGSDAKQKYRFELIVDEGV